MIDFKSGLIIEQDIERKHIPLRVPSNFRLPPYVDGLCYCTEEVDDQGKNPWCTAYAEIYRIEARKWRLYDAYESIERHAELYAREKLIDGMPKVEGSSLTAALQAADDIGLYGDEHPMPEQVTTIEQVMYAIHSRGGLTCALNITDAWSETNRVTIRSGSSNFLGGHAIYVCYYDRDDEKVIGWRDSWRDTGWRNFRKMSIDEFRRQFLYGLIAGGIAR